MSDAIMYLALICATVGFSVGWLGGVAEGRARERSALNTKPQWIKCYDCPDGLSCTEAGCCLAEKNPNFGDERTTP